MFFSALVYTEAFFILFLYITTLPNPKAAIVKNKRLSSIGATPGGGSVGSSASVVETLLV